MRTCGCSSRRTSTCSTASSCTRRRPRASSTSSRRRSAATVARRHDVRAGHGPGDAPRSRTSRRCWSSAKVSQLPVLDGDELVGIISKSDIVIRSIVRRLAVVTQHRVGVDRDRPGGDRATTCARSRRSRRPGTLFMAVVKADGYGHGALRGRAGGAARRAPIVSASPRSTRRSRCGRRASPAPIQLLSEPPETAIRELLDYDLDRRRSTTREFAVALGKQALLARAPRRATTSRSTPA